MMLSRLKWRRENNRYDSHGKKLKFYKLHSSNDKAFLHYIGKEETDKGGESQTDGRKKTKTTCLAHKLFHRRICLLMHMVDY
jgi:hypothetical protein